MKTTISISKKKISVFTLMSAIGVIVALVQSATLLHFLSLDWKLLLLLFITSSIAFLFIAMLIKIFTGKEDHVMLRYFIAIMFLNYFVLQWLNQPVLPCLDILALGYGTITFFGRFGCFMVGCCHGRPNSFGVCYSHDHVKEGFTDYYSGVRLFPVQLAEAFGILLILTISILQIVFYSAPGTALATFVICYSLLRFTIEFFRGDPERPYFFSFSEAQWTTLFLSLLFLALAWTGKIPFQSWEIIATATLALIFLSISLLRIFRPQLRMNEPSHIKEIMTAKLSSPSESVKVLTTSLGINISGSRVDKGFQYAVSSKTIKIDHSLAKKIAAILSLRHPQLSMEIISGKQGIFQVMFRGRS